MENIAVVVNNVVRIVMESSSSSESDSDEEIEEIMTIVIQDRTNYVLRMRCKRYVEDVVSQYTDTDFKNHFRLHRNTFYFILEIVRPILERNGTSGRRTIPPEKQVMLALWMLATPNSYRCVSDRFDVGKATAWRTVQRFVKALYSFLHTFIKWPTREEAAITWNIVKNKSSFPKVIGAIDGTHIRIAAPTINPEAYINRKGYHSIQLQVICDSDLKFIHCYTGQVGSVHDARVYRLSGVQDLCNENYFYENSHLMGDAAYTIDPCVMVPYKDNGHLTEAQVKFNTCHSQGRIMVERAFSLLKGRFRSLLDKLPMTRTDIIPKYIIACCILHNICVLQKDFIDVPIILNEVQLAQHNDFNNIERRNEGIEKRNAIMYSLMNGNI